MAKQDIQICQSTIGVIKYRMDIQQEMVTNDKIEKLVEEIAIENDPIDFIGNLSPEQFQKLAPKDMFRFITGLYSQLSVLRKQIAKHERARLSINYNKVPKDIAYLTKTEAQLRMDLQLCIESAEDFIQM